MVLCMDDGAKKFGLGVFAGIGLGYLFKDKIKSAISGLRRGEKSFVCECLNCGHELITQVHCTNQRCPRCGALMRRSDRPGRGKELR